jgi:hypothetical protein
MGLAQRSVARGARCSRHAVGRWVLLRGFEARARPVRWSAAVRRVRCLGVKGARDLCSCGGAGRRFSNLPVERTRRTVVAMAIGSIFLVGMMPVGWIFVVMTGLAPSCSDHQTDSGHPAETVDSVEATSAATNGSVAPSSDVVASTQLLPTDETTADVLAAAAAYRATESNSFGDSDLFHDRVRRQASRRGGRGRVHHLCGHGAPHHRRPAMCA